MKKKIAPKVMRVQKAKAGFATKVVRSSRQPGVSLSSVKAQMSGNATAYVASLRKPFTLRDLRLPEANGFPSVAGYFQERLVLPAVQDFAVGTQDYIGFVLSPNFQAAASGPQALAPMMVASQVTSGEPTIWTPKTWSNIATLQSTFQMMRIVSCGFRFINTAPLLDRGGVGYVSTIKNVNIPLVSSGTTMASVLASSETKQFDVGQLPEMGDEFTWSPQVLRPETFDVFDPQTNSSLAEDNFLSFHPPNTGLPLMDNSLLLWINTPHADEAGLNISVEIAVNWEAIPFQQNEYLFDRQTVVGSEDDLAVASEMSALAESKTSSTAGNFGAAEDDTVTSLIKGGVSGFKSGGIMGALKGAGSSLLKQVPSLLKKIGSGLLGAFSAQDYANHQIAVHLGAQELSPVHLKANRGLPADHFLSLVLTHLALPNQEEKGSTKPSTIPKGLPVASPVGPPPSAAASAQASDTPRSPDWVFLSSYAKDLKDVRDLGPPLKLERTTPGRPPG